MPQSETVKKGSKVEEGSRDINLTDKQRQRLVEKLAKSFDLIDNFEDIRIINKPTSTLGWTNIRENSVTVNTSPKTNLTFQELLNHIEGLLVHELGHTDRRLEVPTNVEIAKKREEEIKAELGDWEEREQFYQNIINLLEDWEVHYQYNTKNRVKWKFAKKLGSFIKKTRNKIIDKGKEDDIVLSLEYPETDIQKEIRDVVLDRDLSFLDKFFRVKKILENNGMDKKGDMPNPITKRVNVGNEDIEEGEGGEEDKDKKGEGKSQSLKQEVEEQAKEEEAKEKLKKMGFSDREIDEYLKKHSISRTISKIEKLEDCFEDIEGSIEKSFTKLDTLEATKNGNGSRFNGYKRIRSYDEMVDNIEDLVTVGQMDIDEMSVPAYKKRIKTGVVFIIRDTSGSMTSGYKGKLSRDLTVSCIKIGKRQNNHIGVIDFHSRAEPIEDSEGKVVTDNYNEILLDSMKFKSGYTTKLDKAINKLNELIEKNGLEEEQVNIIIITDSRTNKPEERVKGKDVNLMGCWVKEKGYSGNVDSDFEEFIKENEGKIRKVTEVDDDFSLELVKDFS